MYAHKTPQIRCLPAATPRRQPVASSGEVWALDFQCDSDYQGKTSTICKVISEFTYKHVGLVVGRSSTTTAVTDLLQDLVTVRW